MGPAYICMQCDRKCMREYRRLISELIQMIKHDCVIKRFHPDNIYFRNIAGYYNERLSHK